jgi:nitroimidazol reductase NimA-like FMN-containing flavoprotein (pyridoxamine 5'-phosphate oxidase superfamily)
VNLQEMRRNDREISEEEALSVLEGAEYGVLSTTSEEGLPYGIPLSFCILDDHIYFHCAMEGRKISNMEENPRMSFCVVGKTEVMPAKFGTKYESAMVSGMAVEVFDQEKQQALEGLVQKYSADFIESGAKYIEALTHKTRVFKVSIAHLSGKSRKK